MAAPIAVVRNQFTVAPHWKKGLLKLWIAQDRSHASQIDVFVGGRLREGRTDCEILSHPSFKENRYWKPLLFAFYNPLTSDLDPEFGRVIRFNQITVSPNTLNFRARFLRGTVDFERNWKIQTRFVRNNEQVNCAADMLLDLNGEWVRVNSIEVSVNPLISLFGPETDPTKINDVISMEAAIQRLDKFQVPIEKEEKVFLVKN